MPCLLIFGKSFRERTFQVVSLTLQPVPEDLARANPELGQYRMLAIGDQVVLVDPRQQKVVEVVE